VKFNRENPMLIALLGALTNLGSFTTDIYLPAMPMVREQFAIDMTTVQLTLSLAFFGGAIGQVFYGPLSDRFGRRPILLAALFVYTGASLGGLFVQTIDQLVVARILQAVGATAAPVLARAVVRDLHEREAAARTLSLMGIAVGLGSIIAPIIGGLLQARYGWRANFMFVAIYGFLLTALVGFFLGETRDKLIIQKLPAPRILDTLVSLVRSRVFVSYTLVNACLWGGFGAYIAGISFFVVEVLSIPVQFFGAVFGAIMLGNVCGYAIAGSVVPRLGLDRTLESGTRGVAVAGLALAGFAFSGFVHVAALVPPMMLYMFSLAISAPQATAGALNPFPHVAGAASSVIGCLQSLTIAAVGMVVALAFDGTPRALAGLVCLMGVLSFLAYRFIVKRIPEDERRLVKR
jgi:DHA1 family bicyclomycin/chloramphenicol resistance-like MFS transporter